MKKNRPLIFLRWGLLALFVVLVTAAAYLHQVQGGAKAPSIHALCPYGGLESLYQFFSQGSLVSKIFSGTMILFAITMVLAIVFRRSFCGLICPFGAIQEFFAKLGQKVLGRKRIIPAVIDRPLRYLKYVILFLTVFYAWKTAGLWMSPYDPWAAYAHIFEGFDSLINEYALGFAILILTIVGSFVYDRFFCKYLCPMGALYGIVGKISPFKVSRNEKACIDCGKCNRVCPVNIDVQKSGDVKTAECINCQSCVLSCPKEGALEMRAGKKVLKPLVVTVAVLGMFFGSIFLFQALGVYQLKHEPVKQGEVMQPAEVKGYMTIKEAAEATNMELTEFYEKFKIPAEVPETTKMKEISAIVPGYDFHAVKEALEK